MSTPRKYKKRPVVIDAMHFPRNPSPAIGFEIAAWCDGGLNAEANPDDHTNVRYTISIPTLEGVMTADEGDWIIKGVAGEFYPIKPEIFEATYEETDA